MITNVWLKSQHKKKISYPDCYPILHKIITSKYYQNNKELVIKILIIKSNTIVGINTEAEYTIESISRIEFRP